MPVSVFSLFLVSQKRNIKWSPNGIKLCDDFYWSRKHPRDLESKPEEPRGSGKGGGRALGGGLPCGPLGDPLTYLFVLYIHTYSKTLRASHKNTFPPPQPSVPVRSHLGAFSGILPEGDSIMERVYINSIALPMKRE